MHPLKDTSCILLCEQETSKSAKSSMKNSNSSGKDSAAENSEEVSPQHLDLYNLSLKPEHLIQTSGIQIVFASVGTERELPACISWNVISVCSVPAAEWQ